MEIKNKSINISYDLWKYLHDHINYKNKKFEDVIWMFVKSEEYNNHMQNKKGGNAK